MRTTPHAPLTSKDNQTIKELHALADPKKRKKEKAFLIEGVKMVEEALRDNLGVGTVIAAPSLLQHHGKGLLKLAENRGIGVIWISERLTDFLSTSKTPQPVMATIAVREHSEEALLGDNAGLIVVADRLQDPGNLGTIIRTAEAVGASGVAITSRTVDPFNPKTIRASMGSILRLPVARIADISRFTELSKKHGFQTIAAIPGAGKNHFDIDLRKPTIVILGQEGMGLTAEAIGKVDHAVRIPMAPAIDSLNVATAAAVILYEAFRQRSYQAPIG